ncbi:MAG: pyruvate kinase alpha/beta domain-containing protein [Methanoculleaceae archaeon]
MSRYAEKRIYYFNSPGPENTEDALKFAVQRAEELGIRTIVVASTSGATAEKALAAIGERDIRLVVVTHVVGFSKPGVWEFDPETAEKLTERGVCIVTGTHALSGLERALTRSPKVGGGSRTEAIAEALRRVVAVGLKVAVECVLIAADQGKISVDEEVVAVGGTVSGADTVCVIRPAHTAQFFELQVREIVAMPRNR